MGRGVRCTWPNLSPDPLAYAFMRDVLKYFVDGSGVKYRLSPVRTVNNCHRASLKIMLCMAKTERKIMSKVSPMSDEFHDWLESCPVQWFRGEVTKDHVAYYFETPDEDEE